MENTKQEETQEKNVEEQEAGTSVEETQPVEDPKVEKPRRGRPPAQKTNDVEIKEKVKKEEKQGEEAILFNTSGKQVPKEDYFFKGIVPAGFNGTCGKAVDREDLIEVFHKVFKPEDNILFYKQADKEVYIIIVPMKYSNEIGDSQDSFDGDFHKHAISFLEEGSVNIDSLRKKLERIKKFVNYSDR